MTAALGRTLARGHVFNGGLLGPEAPGREVRPPGGCTVDGCGTAVPDAAGMHMVAVAGSREPARAYCSAACARYGQALAELRALPLPAPGRCGTPDGWDAHWQHGEEPCAPCVVAHKAAAKAASRAARRGHT